MVAICDLVQDVETTRGVWKVFSMVAFLNNRYKN